MKKIWLITEEWDDGEFIEPNFPKYHITTYPGVLESQMAMIVTDMEKYSPYDYCDWEEFDTEEEFDVKLEYFKSKGCIINEE